MGLHFHTMDSIRIHHNIAFSARKSMKIHDTRLRKKTRRWMARQTQHPTVSNVTAGEQAPPKRQLEKLKSKKQIILIFSPHKTKDNPMLSLRNHHITEITTCVLHRRRNQFSKGLPRARENRNVTSVFYDRHSFRAKGSQ